MYTRLSVCIFLPSDWKWLPSNFFHCICMFSSKPIVYQLFFNKSKICQSPVKFLLITINWTSFQYKIMSCYSYRKCKAGMTELVALFFRGSVCMIDLLMSSLHSCLHAQRLSPAWLDIDFPYSTSKLMDCCVISDVPANPRGHSLSEC